MPRRRKELEDLLRRSFAEGARWPIDTLSLRMLARMGLTVVEIAQHFDVDPTEVDALLSTA